MRMWMVTPSILCRNHLLGEHRELHMIASSASLLMSSVQGLIDVHLIDLQAVDTRHEALVVEMAARGYNHQSPLAVDTDVWYQFYAYGDMGVDVRNSLHALYWRCDNCRSRMCATLSKGDLDYLENTDLPEAEVARARLPRASERIRRKKALGWSF